MNVGSSDQELVKTPGGGEYSVGDTFKSPDGCNDCACAKDGIYCTMRACAPADPSDPAQPCTDEAKVCADGSTVARTGPSCEFAPCPEEVICPQDAMKCPDGTEVGRSGPNCTFECPSNVACTDDAMLCPDGKTYVSRNGPNCEFSPCP